MEPRMEPMKTTTECQFPRYNHAMQLGSDLIGAAYNSLRERAVAMEMELRRIAASDTTPDADKINIHQTIK
jgi:hypothetical protein